MSDRKLPQVVNDLMAAKKIMASRGMTRGTFVNPVDGSVCIMGALALVVGYIPITFDNDPRLKEAIEYMHPFITPPNNYTGVDRKRMNLAEWNNNVASGLPDCLDLFDKAIEAAQNAYGFVTHVAA